MKGRAVLKAPRAPKGNDIDAMLKFIQEQKEKPSDAKAQAKKLKKISNEQKNREKKANLSNSYMSELRILMKKADYAKQLTTSSLIDLSSNLPELPQILKFDSQLQSESDKVYDTCRACIERLQSLNVLERSVKNNQLYKSVHTEFENVLPLLELPEAYDNVVEIVEKTKLPPSEKKSIDISYFEDEEWHNKAEDTIQVFGKIEADLRKDQRKWCEENGFDPDAKFGGWDDLEHQRFLLTGCGAVTIEFDRPAEEIIAHKKWYIKHQFLNKRIDALRAELKGRLAKMRLEYDEEMERRRLDRIKAEAVEERQRALAEEKREIDAALQVGREEKRIRDTEKAYRAEQERLQNEAEERRRKAAFEREKEELKKKVNSARERRNEEQERIRARREERLAAERLEQKQRLKEAQIAVSGRRHIDEQKMAARAEERKAQQQLEEERQHRLDLLAQQVRDEFGLDDLKADPEKPTKLLEMRRAAEKEERPMYVATSFASSIIEKDPRIRIENALREAGLMNSPYAINVIKQMSALRPSPGMESHLKF